MRVRQCSAAQAALGMGSMRTSEKCFHTRRLLDAAVIAALTASWPRAAWAQSPGLLVSAPALTWAVLSASQSKLWDGSVNDYYSAHWSGTTPSLGDQLQLNGGTVTASLAAGQYITFSPTSSDGQSLSVDGGKLVLKDSVGTGGNGLVADAATLSILSGSISTPSFQLRNGGVLSISGGTLSAQSISLINGSLNFAGGTIRLNAGTLTLPTALPNYTYATIPTGGALVGNGTISGNGVFDNGGTLAVESDGTNTSLNTGFVQFEDKAANVLAIVIDSNNLTLGMLKSSSGINLGSQTFARLSVSDLGSSSLPPGTVFTFATASNGIYGNFANLPDGSALVVGPNTYRIHYLSDNSGGTVSLAVAGGSDKHWEETTSDYHSPHWDGTPPAQGDTLTANSGTITATLADGQYITLSPTSPDGRSLYINGANLLLAGAANNSGLMIDQSVGTLSYGVVTANTEQIGTSFTATFVHIGGSNTTGQLLLATAPGAVANYTMSNHGTLTTGNIYIGGNATSSGGAATLSVTNAYVYNAGLIRAYAGGNLLISGSVLSTQSLDVSQANRFSFTGSLITINGGTFTAPSAGVSVGEGGSGAQLTLNNATLNGGTVSLGEAATLVASGTINTPLVTLSSFATLTLASPGANSTLHTSSLTFNPQSNLCMNISTATSSNDELICSGAVSLGFAQLNVNDVAGVRLAPGSQFVLLSAVGGVNGQFLGRAQGGTFQVGGNTFSVDYHAQGGDSVTLTAVNRRPTDIQLLVNPTNGRVTLINSLQSDQAVMTAFTITSPSGSLIPFSRDASGKYLGNALENNPSVFYQSSNGQTYNRWTGQNNTSTFIGEGWGQYSATDDSTWTNYALSTDGYALGTLFRRLSSGGLKDLTFTWDDQYQMAYTGTVSYVVAPEPGAISLLAMGSLGLLARPKRQRSAPAR